MRYTSESVEQLVEEFAQLPGIGKKTAQRLVQTLFPSQHIQFFVCQSFHNI